MNHRLDRVPSDQPRRRSRSRNERLHRLRIKPKCGGRQLNQISRQEIQLFHTNSPAGAPTDSRLPAVPG